MEETKIQPPRFNETRAVDTETAGSINAPAARATPERKRQD
jgi:hypothetical protein